MSDATLALSARVNVDEILGSSGTSAVLLTLIHRSAWKGNSANFVLTEFSEVGIAPVPPLAPYGRMPRLPCLIPGSAQPAAIVSSSLTLARTLQARPAPRRRRRGFVPLLAACSGGTNRPDQGGKDVGWGEAVTSGVGDVTALAGFSKGVPYTLPPCVRAGLGVGFAERSGYAPWQAERRHRGI
jgi:hypothetical protein